MKALLATIVLVAMALAAVFYLGGFSGFDATEQGKKARAAIGPGMSYTQVFDIAKEPRKYQMIQRKTRRVAGQEIEYFEPGPPNRFKRDSFERRLRDNEMPHGFIISYNYSNKEAFFVTFDGTGTVVGIDDAPTMADLLQTRD